MKPKYSIPVHGEYRHLKAHAGIAESLGIPKENIFILQAGDVLELDEYGYIKTDSDLATNVGGVFAVGDCRTKQLRQMITAASDGANAGTVVAKLAERW